MQSWLYTPIPCVTHYCFNVSLLTNRLIVSKQLWIESLNLSVVHSSFHDPLTQEVKGLSLIHFNNYESGFYHSNLQGKPTCSHALPSQLLLLVELIAMCPETNSKCSMLSSIFASLALAVTSHSLAPEDCITAAYRAAQTSLPLASPKQWRSM